MGDILDQVAAFCQWLWAFWQVKFLLCHIALNVVVAISTSLYTKQFLLVKTGEFLYRKVLPYLLLFGAGAALGEAAGAAWMTAAAFVALEAMLLADLLDNLKEMGLPIPPLLTQSRLSPRQRASFTIDGYYSELDQVGPDGQPGDGIGADKGE